METLRQEILETQKVRSDLLKWKLIIVAALGAAALGINQTSGQPLLLCLIPFACGYLDLLCRHCSIRNKIIGSFIRATPSLELLADYEAFYESVSPEKTLFGLTLESVALTVSTLSVSLLIFFVGWRIAPQYIFWFALSSVAGIAITPPSQFEAHFNFFQKQLS